MPDPKVRDMLPARGDDHTARMADLVAEVREVTEQLEPGQARSCRNAITGRTDDFCEAVVRCSAASAPART